MAAGKSSTISVAVLLLFLFLAVSLAISDENKNQQQTYIVHISETHKPAHYTSHRHWYAATVASLPASPHPARILYTYNRAARGFSARLSPAQAAALRSLPAVLSVFPDRARHLHITHTPAFLGLEDASGLWPNSDYAEDVIVGMLDTGIWPERRSFSDEGLSPVPGWWKGKCVGFEDFPAELCNRKLIGARAYHLGFDAAMGVTNGEDESERSARDTEGHGTHTASTAAGAVVSDAGFYEFARGEARGMATKARIAVYKICWSLGCYDSDILAAMDQAVADGVNIISLSVGANGYSPAYKYDSIAIGAFGAMENGVVVSCSAGNSGPGPYSAVNIAPWILTVGASTVDREFRADVVLGDGKSYGGVSLYSGDHLEAPNYTLVYAGDCGSKLCLDRRLDPKKVAGKIVICDRGSNARVAKGSAVKLAGGVGMILANTEENGEELVADSHVIPATMVGQAAGDKIRAYAKSGSSSPTATINFRGTVIGATSPSAPKVAAFSSRGPNYRTPEILKPDVIAPGVNILAAWTGASSPTDIDSDPRRVEFNIISGTSMSCPHVSGLAALLRKAYPNWTPAAIKSALMTTAYNADNSGETIGDLATGGPSTPFVFGAGHVDPNKALHPGLVYDITPIDYVAFLCTIGYNAREIAVFSRNWPGLNCSALALGSPGNINYPSFSVLFKSGVDTVEYHRTVTNVGGSLNAVYEVKVEAPAGVVDVVVSPTKLVFGGDEQQLSYTVKFTSLVDRWQMSGIPTSGAITWTDGVHVVRSPVAIRWSGVPIASF